MRVGRKLPLGFGLTLVLAAVLAMSGRLVGVELSEYGNPFTWVAVGEVSIKAEVVKTPEKIYLGLSGRQGLPEGRGLLFLMPTENYQHFCMRDMLFPIDIIWIARGKVMGIHPNLSPEDQKTFSSPAPASQVLEVPGGFAARYGLKVGDEVRMRP